METWCVSEALKVFAPHLTDSTHSFGETLQYVAVHPLTS